MVFQCINIHQVPWEVLKTAAFGLGFQHLPRDLANVNARKTMLDPYMWIRIRIILVLTTYVFVEKKNAIVFGYLLKSGTMGHLVFALSAYLQLSESSRKHAYIILTPLNLLYSKTGVYRGIHYFPYFC